ncbi:hypothetical protein C2S52_002067 [Perilla frutescens var. hirtella]|nr:hypothetical protein C2S52_002067 [Perilla frutescens var. hirtella]KAH6819663.1 hypothetical protein C2S51_003266 [Perilla frutescens var. frutescens]
MAAAGEVCMGESRRGMFAKVRAKNSFILNFGKRDAADEKRQQQKDGSSSPSSSPATARSDDDDTMPETTVLLLLDRFAPC